MTSTHHTRSTTRGSRLVGVLWLALITSALLVPSSSTAASSIESPHFVSSTPRHASVLRTAPRIVRLNFDFDLARGSSIVVRRNGTRVNRGTSITNDQLRLQTPVTSTAAGRYAVSYTACWPDGSCHAGRFHFTVRAS